MSLTGRGDGLSSQSVPPTQYQQAPIHIDHGTMQLPSMSSLLSNNSQPLGPDAKPKMVQFSGYANGMVDPLQYSETHPTAPIHHIYHSSQPLDHTLPPRQYTEIRKVAIEPNNDFPPSMSYPAPPRRYRQSKKISQRRTETPKELARFSKYPALETRFGQPCSTSGSHEQQLSPFSRPRHSRFEAPTTMEQPAAEPSSAMFCGPAANMTQFNHSEYIQCETPKTMKMSAPELVSRSMPISGLLRHTTPPASSGPLTYNIVVRQQPESARACGFGERDRRVIDPPPILVLDIEGGPTSASETYVVFCNLWNPEADADDGAMPVSSERKQQRRLMGTNIASPFYGKDENNVQKHFFPFPDLSVRTPGTYSLSFSLVVMDLSRMHAGHRAPVVATVKSNTFKVFNAKDFGGMRPSTRLTKCLKAQGCLIPVKKGNSKTKAAKLEEYDDDEDDD